MNNFGISDEIYLSILNVFKENIVTPKSECKQCSNGNKLKVIDKLEDIRCILKFDVVDIDKTNNELLLKNINRDGIVIYSNR